MSILSKKHFHDEAAAFHYLEATLWPDGPTCPHCGNADASRITRLAGKAHRIGVLKCNECRKQFTVKVGTVFEHGRMPLHKMLQAVYLMSCSKNGVSAHQLHRILQITYKSAWFLAHRIREAMRDGSLAPMGGSGKIVEFDETSQGRQEGAPTRLHQGGWHHRNVVFTLVERGGAARSWHVDGTTVGTLMPIIRANIAHETAVMTDQASWYRKPKQIQSPKEQAAGFRKAARELGCDESEPRFQETLRAVVKQKPRPHRSKKQENA